MSSSILKRLLKRYSKGSANRAERFIVDRWYGSFQELGDLTPGIETPSKSAEKEEKMFDRIMAGTKPVKLWYNHPGFKIAASVILVTSVILFFTKRKPTAESFTVYQTQKGQTKKIVLPDSSVAWLNAATELKVAANYGKGTRKMSLQGEAYFEVKHNVNAPFIIATDKLKTQVLGTSFNVSAYKDLNQIDVVVRTGKVSVSDPAKLLGMLTPGKAIHYDRQHSTSTISIEDPELMIGWLNGRIMLNSVTFTELSERFNNNFNIKLTTRNQQIEKLQFRLMLDKSVSMEENLNVITDIHQLKYRRINQHEIELYSE